MSFFLLLLETDFASIYLHFVKNKQAHILLVEDDPVDIVSIKRAFKAQKIATPLHVATSGTSALNLLRGGNGVLALSPTPKIILLDLKLPGMDGLEFLKELRQDTALCASSVFVMTGSKSMRDVLEAHDLNVAGYILKPISYESVLEMVSILNSFWELIELPN